MQDLYHRQCQRVSGLGAKGGLPPKQRELSCKSAETLPKDYKIPSGNVVASNWSSGCRCRVPSNSKYWWCWDFKFRVSMTNLLAARVARHPGLCAVDKGAEHASGLCQAPAPTGPRHLLGFRGCCLGSLSPNCKKIVQCLGLCAKI